MLRLGLDAFRRRRHAERAGDADHRLDDDDVLVTLRQIRHERPVDLDLVERKAAQIAQRGIAGAEIIERDPHAEALDPAQRGKRILGVLHEDAFGDLELEAVRRQTGPGEGLLDHLEQVRRGELQPATD